MEIDEQIYKVVMEKPSKRDHRADSDRESVSKNIGG